MKQLKEKSGWSGGFTLIEVIAVLVVVAVLAALAFPRYLSLIDDARQQALEGALAAGTSHISLSYGRLALQVGREPPMVAVAADATATPPRSTDYVYSFAATATPGINITVTEAKDVTLTDTREWIRP